VALDCLAQPFKAHDRFTVVGVERDTRPASQERAPLAAKAPLGAAKTP
jgi:hypothetical protein